MTTLYELAFQSLVSKYYRNITDEDIQLEMIEILKEFQKELI